MEPVAIHLDKAGKRFGREWIFRGLDRIIQPGERLAILGGNGSGKSTLLQVIAGFVTLNEGTLTYKNGEKITDKDYQMRFVSFASPYLQLPEDLTASEVAEHLGNYKPYISGSDAKQVLEIARLDHASGKLVKNFSSGMKQRLKLALAFLADTPVICLDEPTSNLDRAAIEWYARMVADYATSRTVIVCSNSVEEEYAFCQQQLRLEDYKKTR